MSTEITVSTNKKNNFHKARIIQKLTCEWNNSKKGLKPNLKVKQNLKYLSNINSTNIWTYAVKKDNLKPKDH